MPNRADCTLEELKIAVKAAPIQRTNLRLMAIKGLSMGIPHEQVAALFGVNEDSVSRLVARFNERGIDGLTEDSRSGHPPKIRGDRSREYCELILHPEQVNQTHWTERKFHGYLSTYCQLEAGYSMLMRCRRRPSSEKALCDKRRQDPSLLQWSLSQNESHRCGLVKRG
jgi:transposase